MAGRVSVLSQQKKKPLDIVQKTTDTLSDPLSLQVFSKYICALILITSSLLQDGQSRTVRQFQFTDWPEQGVPKSGEGFIDFIGQVHKTKEQFGQDGPISVHCRLAARFILEARETIYTLFT